MYFCRKKYIQILLFFLSLWCLFISVYSYYNSNSSGKSVSWEQRSVILLDVSQSMNIEDMPQKQSRLLYAKKYIEQYILQSPGLIWISIFAWNGVNISPLSGQKSEIIELITGLDYRHIREQWSRIDIWIKNALELFWDEHWWRFIIFTDQDSLEWSQYEERLKELKKIIRTLWLEIHLIWVGTTEWWYIPIWTDIMGNKEYKRYNGELVLVPLEREYLKSVARTLWGKYQDIDEFKAPFLSTYGSWEGWSWKRVSYIFLIISCILFFLNLCLTFSRLWSKIFLW